MLGTGGEAFDDRVVRDHGFKLRIGLRQFLVEDFHHLANWRERLLERDWEIESRHSLQKRVCRPTGDAIPRVSRDRAHDGYGARASGDELSADVQWPWHGPLLRGSPVGWPIDPSRHASAKHPQL
jgi:hypothetical protein